jgi:hypothetical protein
MKVTVNWEEVDKILYGAQYLTVDHRDAWTAFVAKPSYVDTSGEIYNEYSSVSYWKEGGDGLYKGIPERFSRDVFPSGTGGRFVPSRSLICRRRGDPVQVYEVSDSGIVSP